MAAPSITTIAATDKLSDSRSTINTNLANIAAFLDQHVKTTSTPTFAGLALGAGSITMSGSIGVTGTRVTKGWFTDLEVTNSIAGSITGDSATCSGLAASATILATARAINGVDFNGSAAITVTAAAGTLTGDTLKSTILASSLTSVGTLLDLTVTNTITGGVSGNAGTVTNGVYTTSNVNVLADITSTGANIEDAVSKKHTQGTDTTLGTITGDIQLGEIDIKLDAVLSADEKWSGIVIAVTLGSTVAQGEICFLAADGKWDKNDGILDGTDTGFSKQLGICLVAGNDTNASEMLIYGKVRSAGFPAFTVGSPVYLDDTAGDLVVAQPSTTNFAIRIVGYAITAEDLFFNPSNDYIVHV